MTRKAKQIFTDYGKKQKKTGGGPPPPKPSEATTKIIDLMGESPSFSGIDGGIESMVPLLTTSSKYANLYLM